MYFWDVASGKEVRQVAASEFVFESGSSKQLRSNQHLLEADGDTLHITVLWPHGGAADIEDDGVLAACFKAPQPISTVRCHGTAICVGCKGGAVCILRVPFLAL